MNRTTQRDERNKTRSFRAAFAARDRAAARATQDEVVAKIAREVLGLDTLETRKSDLISRNRRSGRSGPRSKRRTTPDWLQRSNRGRRDNSLSRLADFT
jgi:hypothetical protein